MERRAGGQNDSGVSNKGGTHFCVNYDAQMSPHHPSSSSKVPLALSQNAENNTTKQAYIPKYLLPAQVAGRFSPNQASLFQPWWIFVLPLTFSFSSPLQIERWFRSDTRKQQCVHQQYKEGVVKTTHRWCWGLNMQCKWEKNRRQNNDRPQEEGASYGQPGHGCIYEGTGAPQWTWRQRHRKKVLLLIF